EIIGDVNDVDATYFANIFILADKDGTSSLSNPNSATTKVAVNQSQLNVQTEGHNTVKLFSMDGRLLRQSLESDDFSWDLSGFQGIYILQIGTQRTKIAL
ncbi:MAG: T9SS type A sorting domain-containing protein, partial [Bacteroidales bacterium]|nr:T9SS type A sorting domain-containing protein [Bacteroidales bacterium]